MAKFKWVVEFEVDEVWVADGFNLTDERAKTMLADDLAHACSWELSAKVLSAPSASRIARAQGYASAAAMQAGDSAESHS